MMLSTQESEIIPTAPLNLPLCREEQAWEGTGSHLVSACTRETFSLPKTFGPVSFLSPCHHWNRLNVLISSAYQRRRESFQEGRKTAGKREKNLNCLFPSLLAIVLKPYRWDAPISKVLPSLPHRLRHFKIFLLFFQVPLGPDIFVC